MALAWCAAHVVWKGEGEMSYSKNRVNDAAVRYMRLVDEQHRLMREKDCEVKRLQREQGRLFGVFTSPELTAMLLRMDVISDELDTLIEMNGLEAELERLDYTNDLEDSPFDDDCDCDYEEEYDE